MHYGEIKNGRRYRNKAHGGIYLLVCNAHHTETDERGYSEEFMIYFPLYQRNWVLIDWIHLLIVKMAANILSKYIIYARPAALFREKLEPYPIKPYPCPLPIDPLDVD